MPSTYVLEGVWYDSTTDTGGSFDFPGVRFDTAGEAYAYAQRYAHGVSHTDEVVDYPPESDFDGYVRAVGANYSERITVREIVGE